MRRHLLVPLTVLAVAVPAGSTLPAAAVTGVGSPRAGEGAACGTTALSKRVTVRAGSGAKLGTARLYDATAGADRGFCVRIKPVRRLRTKTTAAYVTKTTFYPDGQQSSSGMIGGSGLWKQPFLFTGSILTPGSTIKAVVRLQPSRGAKGKAVLEGTLP